MLERINQFNDKYAFLSNFYASEVLYEDLVYPTVEHAYQAAKTTDIKIRENFAWRILTAKEAKQEGRKLIIRKDWESIKLKVMEELLRKKFLDHMNLRFLLKTETAWLEEGNYWHDNFWGNCSCVKCSNIEGKNNLGMLLMNIRFELRKFRMIFE